MLVRDAKVQLQPFSAFQSWTQKEKYVKLKVSITLGNTLQDRDAPIAVDSSTGFAVSCLRTSQ